MALPLATQLTPIVLGKLNAVPWGEAAKALGVWRKVPFLSPKRSFLSRAVSFLIPGSLGAFGAGVAVGAGLGVFLAPCSGSQLRSNIAGYVRKLAGRSGKSASGNDTLIADESGVQQAALRTSNGTTFS